MLLKIYLQFLLLLDDYYLSAIVTSLLVNWNMPIDLEVVV